MEDDEAQRENDQLQANKVGNTALMMAEENDPDENAEPILDKAAAQQQFGQQPVATTNLAQKPMEMGELGGDFESAPAQPGGSLGPPSGFTAKQIQNQMGTGRMRPQSAKTVPTVD